MNKYNEVSEEELAEASRQATLEGLPKHVAKSELGVCVVYEHPESGEYAVLHYRETGGLYMVDYLESGELKYRFMLL